jgi:dinuclear metal center YbgI/SA1388 family protein
MAEVRTEELVAFLDELLEPGRFQDAAPNGLQVPGPERVARVVTGVSAHVELLRRAAEASADLVLVHHGLFWRGAPLHVTRPLHARLRPLFEHDMALAAYHLPLDGHPEHGNNALLAEALGCIATEPFAPHHGTPIGVVGRFADHGVAIEALLPRVEEVCDRRPLAFTDGPHRVRHVAVVSGAGSDFLPLAVEQGIDAFLTGEPAERDMAVAREGRVHYLAAGHHATERLGVRRLGELVEDRFGIHHQFVDVANPI